MNNAKLDEVLRKVVDQPDYMNAAVDSQGNNFLEISKDFGKSMGITVCGGYAENGDFMMDYYYPYFRGTGVTSEEQIDIEKYAEKESYAAVCDDIKIGVTLIFYLQNVAEYLNQRPRWENQFQPNLAAVLSGLSLGGKIILPISKSEKQIQNRERMTRDRNHLIAAARDGNEDAIESLTLEDIDTYTMISKRIMTEDILSIVDTSFMPYGIESDQYSIVGEILDICYTTNEITGQKVYILKLDTNDLVYDICINEKDLLGEPKVGRRFRGDIWMQGKIKIES